MRLWYCTVLYCTVHTGGLENRLTDATCSPSHTSPSHTRREPRAQRICWGDTMRVEGPPVARR